MASQPAATTTEVDQLRSTLGAMRQRNAKRRERVLEHAANLGRIAEKLRAADRRR